MSVFAEIPKDLYLKMTVRKIFIRFCKNIESFVMKSITGWIFDLCRVEFSKISKRDVMFIREMRVSKTSSLDRSLSDLKLSYKSDTETVSS